MLCAKCGTLNADNDRFCFKCGTPLSSAPRPAAPVAPNMNATGLACTKCGNKNNDSDRFCFKCGTPLTPARTAAAMTPNLNAAGVACTRCGNKNNETDRFCFKCGNPLNTPVRPAATMTPNVISTGVVCAKCATPNAESDRFCFKCGTPLSPPVRAAAPPTAPPKTDAQIMDATGVNAHLDLFQEKITIKREDQEISLIQIASIQIQEAGASTNGYIKFNLSGEPEGGELENTILFTREQQKTFEAIKHVIDEIILKNAASTANSIHDLEKLAELKTKGIITEEEFKAKKKQILGL